MVVNMEAILMNCYPNDIQISIDKGLQSLAIRKGTMDESIYVGKIFDLNEPP